MDTAPVSGPVKPSGDATDLLALVFGVSDAPVELRRAFAEVEGRRDVSRLASLLPVLLGVHLVDLIAFGLRDVDAGAAGARWEGLILRGHAAMAVVALGLWIMARRFRAVPVAGGRRDRWLVAFIAASYVGFSAWLAGVDQLVTSAITPFAIGQLFAAVLLTLSPSVAAIVHLGGCAVLVFFVGVLQDDPAMALSNTVNGLSMTLVAWGVGRITASSRLRAFLDHRKIEEQQKELAAANAELHRLATHDPLTGLANRRWLLEQAEQLASLVERQKRPIHVLLIDVDHFKLVNDTHGHAVGDEVLRVLSRTVTALLRKSDVAGRLGGEEFAIIAPDTNAEGARQLAERLRSAIEKVHPPVRGLRPVTISVGVAPLEGHGPAGVEEAFLRADEALYEAKRAGRNRVSSPPMRSEAV